MNMYEIRNVDLNKVQGSDFIKFIRAEIPIRNGFGTVRFARVRYALNGNHDEEVNGLPMDLGKRIFTATLEDEELNGIHREELEKILQKAAVEIVKIVREEIDPPLILKSILKAYPYLKYDKRASEPPHLLRCRVNDPKHSRHAEHIFEIAQRLKYATGVDYKVVTYGGSSSEGDNLDEVWTSFSLRNFNFAEKHNEK